jgi:hypothetical protein
VINENESKIEVINMSIFSGITNATASKQGRYIRPGKHDLRIKEIKSFESAKKAGRWFFCVEAEVLDYRPAATVDSAEYESGDTVTWLVDMDQASALDNIKGFTIALLPDVPSSDIDESMMEELIGSDQPAKGVRVCCDAVEITTRRGTPFTKVNWGAAKEVEAE